MVVTEKEIGGFDKPAAVAGVTGNGGPDLSIALKKRKRKSKKSQQQQQQSRGRRKK